MIGIHEMIVQVNMGMLYLTKYHMQCYNHVQIQSKKHLIPFYLLIVPLIL